MISAKAGTDNRVAGECKSCCVTSGVAPGKKKHDQFAASSSNAPCLELRTRLEFPRPHLVEAAGLDGGEVGNVVLLEAAGTGALLDHGMLKKARGGNINKTEKRERQAIKIRKRVPQGHYKHPTSTQAVPSTAARP